MRFLIDENLSPRLGELLHDEGHDVVHVRGLGLTSSPDAMIIEVARAQNRVLISADTDFGTILALTRASSPSFLLLRRISVAAAEQVTRRPRSDCFDKELIQTSRSEGGQSCGLTLT